MSNGLVGKVALITGAARGQGRSHAVTLAEAGVDIVAIDICSQIDTVGYPMATAAELDETRALVEKAGAKIVTQCADVRSLDEMRAAVRQGQREFGRLDIVIANAAIGPGAALGDREFDAWVNVIATNLTGVWTTVSAAKDAMIEGERGGSIIMIGSTASLRAFAGGSASSHAYVASKHGLIGLMKSFALELAPHWIRVNAVLPTGVATPMIDNDATRAWIEARAADSPKGMRNLLPVDRLESADVSSAVRWLVSDEARKITGIALPVDAGFTAN